MFTCTEISYCVFWHIWDVTFGLNREPTHSDPCSSSTFSVRSRSTFQWVHSSNAVCCFTSIIKVSCHYSNDNVLFWLFNWANTQTIGYQCVCENQNISSLVQKLLKWLTRVNIVHGLVVCTWRIEMYMQIHCKYSSSVIVCHLVWECTSWLLFGIKPEQHLEAFAWCDEVFWWAFTY